MASWATASDPSFKGFTINRQKRERRGEQERIAIEFCRAGFDAKAFIKWKIDDFIGIAILNGCLGEKCLV